MTINELKNAVRGRRQELGLSQASLATLAGVSRKWIYEFEAGKPSAEVGMLLQVLEALGLDIDLTSRGSAASTSDRAPEELMEALEASLARARERPTVRERPPATEAGDRGSSS